MTEVAATDSCDAPNQDATATTQPPTPPTNPTNSSEPVSPPEKLPSDQISIPTLTRASTVPEASSNPKAESSDANPSAPPSEVPVTTTAPSPAEVPKSAVTVATLAPLPPDPNSNHSQDMAPTPTTITVEQSQNDSEKIEPVKSVSPQKSELRQVVAFKSEALPSRDPRSDSVSSQPHPISNSDEPKADLQQKSDDAPNSAPKATLPSPLALLKRLPKVAKSRPENARVFIGNLASEYTSTDEILSIFQKYGTLIEEPVLRRSFGFVQYSTAEAAARAAKAEQGRIIGGIGIDLSIADNREVKKGTHVQNNTPFQHARAAAAGYHSARGRVRERDNAGAVPDPRKKRRSVSPGAASRKGGVHPPQYRRFRPEPKNGVYLRILCMSPTAKGYAKHCENTFRSMTGLKADILHILAAGLGEALGRAMRDTIPYVMVVASKDVDDGTCTIRTLEKTGYEKSGRGNGVIPLREAVEVCLIERGVIAPTNVAHQVGPPGVPNRPSGAHGGIPMNSRGPPPPGGAQWLNQSHQTPSHMESAKPGWMTGPRPPHPANQAAQRPPPHMPPPPMAGVGSGASSGYGYGDGRPPYGHTGPPPPPPSHGQSRPDVYGRGGGPQPYEAPSGVGPRPNVNQEYGRNGHTQQYQSQMHPAGGYQDRYGSQQMGIGNNYGQPNGRDSEYDPANVIPSQRPAQSSGYATWNRDQGQGDRDVYNSDMQGPGMEPPPNYQPAPQPYPNQVYGGNQSYSDRQGQMYAAERANQPGQYGAQQSQSYGGRAGQNQYDSYDGGVPYRRENPRDVNNGMTQQDGRYSNDGYSGSSGAYQAGGFPQRDIRAGWDHQQAASVGPSGGVHGMSNTGPMGYGSEPAPQPQPHNGGYGADYRNVQNPYDGGRPSDAPRSQYNVGRGNSAGDVRDPRGNQRYDPGRGGVGMPSQQYPDQLNSGNNIQSQQPTQATVSGSGTVDIGKLTNLISAFQQKQQSSQQSRSQQQQQQYQQQQQQPLQGRSHLAAQNQGAGRGMQGDRQGVAQFLQMPGVQQALQNIGGARLGGPQDMYQQGVNQQNVGMGGSMAQNRGRGPDQGGQSHQGYYG